MARRPEYQRLLNSKQWRELRAWYMRLHPLCERCIEEGYIRSAVDCHHIKEQMAERRQAAFERWKARMEGQKGDSQEDTQKV